MKYFIYVIICLSASVVKGQTPNIQSTSSTLNDHRIKAGKRVSYDLYISDTTVNYSGRKAHAMAINGQIPGPQLEFTEGDTAYIRVHNEMKTET